MIISRCLHVITLGEWEGKPTYQCERGSSHRGDHYAVRDDGERIHWSSDKPVDIERRRAILAQYADKTIETESPK